MKALYQISQDPAYATLDIASQLADSFYARLASGGVDFEQATRGRPLAGLWNDQWVFTAYVDRRGQTLAEFALLGARLITATTLPAKDLLQSFLGDAETLVARNEHGDLMWFSNVIRAIDREMAYSQDENAVFRVNPIRNSVYCSTGFKMAIDRSNMRGLRFREVAPEDMV